MRSVSTASSAKAMKIRNYLAQRSMRPTARPSSTIKQCSTVAWSISSVPPPDLHCVVHPPADAEHFALINIQIGRSKNEDVETAPTFEAMKAALGFNPLARILFDAGEFARGGGQAVDAGRMDHRAGLCGCKWHLRGRSCAMEPARDDVCGILCSAFGRGGSICARFVMGTDASSGVAPVGGRRIARICE